VLIIGMDMMTPTQQQKQLKSNPEGDPTYIVWVFDEELGWFTDSFHLCPDRANARCEEFDQAYVEDTVSFEVDE